MRGTPRINRLVLGLALLLLGDLSWPSLLSAGAAFSSTTGLGGVPLGPLRVDPPVPLGALDLGGAAAQGPLLAQRRTPQTGTGLATPVPSSAGSNSQSPARLPLSAFPGPRAPTIILYDQLNNPGGFATSSQQFEAANAAFNAQLADDFVVPAGQTWTVSEVDVAGVYFNGPGPAASVNVFFYANNPG